MQKSDNGYCLFQELLYLCIRKSYLTAQHRKSLKFARSPNRYLCFSNNSLKVYSSIGCIKPMKIYNKNEYK